jgi:protein TonB
VSTESLGDIEQGTGELQGEKPENSAPAFVKSVTPKYPQKLKKKGIEGKVYVECIIEKEGSVDPNSLIIKKTVHSGFNDVVVEALKESTFTPSIEGGVPVRSKFIVQYAFALE